MNVFAPSPETIALLQSFGHGIAQNLIASAIVEWKKLKDDHRAQESAAWVEDIEHRKSIERRISQSVSQALRDLNIGQADLNVLLPLGSDPVLSAELARQIVSDKYSADSVAKLLLGHLPLPGINDSHIRELADTLIQAVQSAIAEDPHLCRIKQLQFQARTTEDISDLHKELSARFSKTEDTLNQLPASLRVALKSELRAAMAEGSPEAEHLKSQNQKRFDRARMELLSGSVVVAEKEYRALVADLESQGTSADKTLLFRSYTNLGSSLWQQFRRDEAAEWFDKAYIAKPDEEKGKTNRAACLIHRREFEAALAILNEVKATNPDCFEAHYLASCVYLEQGDVAQAIALLERRPFESSSYFQALAEAYLRREDCAKAAEAARTALTKTRNSTEALMTLANSLGFPLVHRRLRGGSGAFSLTDSEHQQVLEAIRSGETAVTALRAQSRVYQLGEMLTNLAAFHELLGDDESAAAAAREAVECAPQNVTTLKNLWAAQMRLGKYVDAYETARKLIQVGEKMAGKLRQLESLLFQSEYERLLSESAEDSALAGDLHREPRFWELKAQTHFQLHQVEAAFTTINEALGKFPDSARLYAARASLYEELGQLDEAREDLERAEKGEEDALRTLLHAAMFYYFHNDWSAAAQRFLKLGADSIYSPFLDKYLVCLHNLKQFLQCFELATKAIAVAGQFNPTLHELAARCAYNANDLPAAKIHFEKLVQQHTAKVVEHQKMLAQVYMRLDETEKAFAVLKKAHARTPGDLDVLIGLSFTCTLRKQHKAALEYAATAVRAANQNPRAHMALVKAGLDCPPEFKIDDRQRNLFQSSLEFLDKHQSGLIKAVPVEADLRSVTAMVKARADHAHRIENLIQRKNLPMALLGQQLGLSPFDAWAGLIAHPKFHVRMAYGNAEEQAKEAEAALRGGAVSVDVFALFTLQLLRQLNLLRKLYTRVFVHTAVFEAIVEHVRELETRDTSTTIGYDEGKLFRFEIGSEQMEQRLSFLRNIRDFLKSPAVELVGLDAGFVSSEEMKKACDVLGRLYYEPLLVAKSRGASYYADDAAMRVLAANSHGVTSFCTQALLRAAKEKKLLTDVEYEDAIIKLLRHNYHFVSESVTTLARLLESEAFQPSELAKTMLGRVAEPTVDRNTAVRVLSEFCFFVWRADLSKTKSNREVWLELCLDSLLRAKQPEELFSQFLVNLGIRALPQPTAFGGITSWILRRGKLQALQRHLFFIGVQQVIVQMRTLATQQYAWWWGLQDQWRQLGRLNDALDRNGWL
jgi:tetratricopeptide (TPR) repeat protein